MRLIENRSRGNKSSRAVILERRSKVKELHFMRGLSVNEICNVLKWNRNTILRDIKCLKEEIGDLVKNGFIDAIRNNLVILHKKVCSSLWREYHSASDEDLKSRILVSIHRAEGTYIRSLLRVGLLPDIKEKVDTSIAEGIEEGYRLALKRKKQHEADMAAALAETRKNCPNCKKGN